MTFLIGIPFRPLIDFAFQMFPFSLCCTDDNLSIRGKSIYKLNKMTWYPSVPEFIKLFKHEGDWLVGPGLPRASVIRSAKDLFFADWSFKLIEVPHLWFCPFRGVFFFFFFFSSQAEISLWQTQSVCIWVLISWREWAKGSLMVRRLVWRWDLFLCTQNH